MLAAPHSFTQHRFSRCHGACGGRRRHAGAIVHARPGRAICAEAHSAGASVLGRPACSLGLCTYLFLLLLSKPFTTCHDAGRVTRIGCRVWTCACLTPVSNTRIVSRLCCASAARDTQAQPLPFAELLLASGAQDGAIRLWLVEADKSEASQAQDPFDALLEVGGRPGRWTMHAQQTMHVRKKKKPLTNRSCPASQAAEQRFVATDAAGAEAG